jgi:hypothetical protein
MTATAATSRPAGLSAEPMTGVQSEQRLRRTIQYWRAWSAECTYEGPYRDRGAQRINVEAAQLCPDLRMCFLLASIREQR